MENIYLSLDERPEKKAVSILMVIFGFLCLGTSGWWAIFIVNTPEQRGSFWIATLFLFLFGLYQIYAGLGYARRYAKINGKIIILRQNSFFSAKQFSTDEISEVAIRSADILFK